MRLASQPPISQPAPSAHPNAHTRFIRPWPPTHLRGPPRLGRTRCSDGRGSASCWSSAAARRRPPRLGPPPGRAGAAPGPRAGATAAGGTRLRSTTGGCGCPRCSSSRRTQPPAPAHGRRASPHSPAPCARVHAGRVEGSMVQASPLGSTSTRSSSQRARARAAPPGGAPLARHQALTLPCTTALARTGGGGRAGGPPAGPYMGGF
jgi:hypothetical protein